MFQAQELTHSINKKGCIVDGVQDKCEIHPKINSFRECSKSFTIQKKRMQTSPYNIDSHLPCQELLLPLLV